MLTSTCQLSYFISQLIQTLDQEKKKMFLLLSLAMTPKIWCSGPWILRKRRQGKEFEGGEKSTKQNLKKTITSKMLRGIWWSQGACFEAWLQGGVYTSLTLTVFFNSFESSLQDSICVTVVQAPVQGWASHGPQAKCGLAFGFVKKKRKVLLEHS